MGNAPDEGTCVRSAALCKVWAFVHLLGSMTRSDLAVLGGAGLCAKVLASGKWFEAQRPVVAIGKPSERAEVALDVG